MKNTAYLGFLLLFITTGLFGQEPQRTEPTRFVTKGGLIGYGNTISNNTDYETWFLMADYSRSFRKPRKNVFVAWYAQPQFNLVKATNTEAGNVDVEFGLNLGIRNYIRFSDGFYFYQQLGSGPHYISARLDRQARGFIFSDNLQLGFLLKAGPGFINIQGGPRHISNANLDLPNRGVNSIIGLIGYSQGGFFNKRRP